MGQQLENQSPHEQEGSAQYADHGMGSNWRVSTDLRAVLQQYARQEVALCTLILCAPFGPSKKQ